EASREAGRVASGVRCARAPPRLRRGDRAGLLDARPARHERHRRERLRTGRRGCRRAHGASRRRDAARGRCRGGRPRRAGSAVLGVDPGRSLLRLRRTAPRRGRPRARGAVRRDRDPGARSRRARRVQGGVRPDAGLGRHRGDVRGADAGPRRRRRRAGDDARRRGRAPPPARRSRATGRGRL
ncbi:MAG: hypothetical protein AVDCRST_MAG53-2641, partial [uncultured Solirubrobacteraceae bacterium]